MTNQEKIASDWYCYECECLVDGKHVTYEETHDVRYGGCGQPVGDRYDDSNNEKIADIKKTYKAFGYTGTYYGSMILPLLVELDRLQEENRNLREEVLKTREEREMIQPIKGHEIRLSVRESYSTASVYKNGVLVASCIRADTANEAINEIKTRLGKK